MLVHSGDGQRLVHEKTPLPSDNVDLFIQFSFCGCHSDPCFDTDRQLKDGGCCLCKLVHHLVCGRSRPKMDPLMLFHDRLWGSLGAMIGLRRWLVFGRFIGAGQILEANEHGGVHTPDHVQIGTFAWVKDTVPPEFLHS